MPAKLERCVEEVMKNQGMSEQRAYAICNASLSDKPCKDGFVLDYSAELKTKIDDTTGFLTAPVVLSRTGVQYYYGIELGLKDRATEKIGVFRPEKEVFSDDSLKSFINLVVTDDHPKGFVTTDNVKQLQKGTVSQVEIDGNNLVGMITVTDKKTIDKIQNNKYQVSVGYAQKLIADKGEYKGDEYEFVQTDIRANHLAIVDRGRCGPDCKITLDNKGETVMEKITIDGISYEVDNSQLVQAIQKYMKDAEESKTEAEKKLEEINKKMDELMAKKDAIEAEMKQSKTSDEQINKLVAERAELLTKAKTILGDKMPACMDCTKDIKTLVVEHVLDGIDLTNKSDAYLDAAFDMAVQRFEKAKDSTNKFQQNLNDKEKVTLTRDSARDAYLKRTFAA